MFDEHDWYQACDVWLYRGAWHEWEPHEIEMAVPLSPAEVMRKRDGHLQTRIAKGPGVVPGPDVREFWQRAEDRNAERPDSTMPWAWPNTKRWRASFAGMVR